MLGLKNKRPRGFNHQYIYVNERKEKLDKMEKSAKEDLGMTPPKKINPEEIRGSFVKGTKHLKRKKERSKGKVSLNFGLIIFLIIILLYLWHYIQTNSFTF